MTGDVNDIVTDPNTQQLQLQHGERHTEHDKSVYPPSLQYQPQLDTPNLVIRRGNQHSFSSKSRMNFRDKIRIICTGGNGGAGAVSFQPHFQKRGRPDGGSGGDGGNVILKCGKYMGGFTFSKQNFQFGA